MRKPVKVTSNDTWPTRRLVEVLRQWTDVKGTLQTDISFYPVLMEDGSIKIQGVDGHDGPVEITVSYQYGGTHA
jgi:hypothetical protein